ncbi:MAG: hypothetical protein H6581_14305 [Bacteroidia bacterium]|nr:hypothetical protein [Bacteroidia bacterium]
MKKLNLICLILLGTFAVGWSQSHQARLDKFAAAGFFPGKMENLITYLGIPARVLAVSPGETRDGTVRWRFCYRREQKISTGKVGKVLTPQKDIQAFLQQFRENEGYPTRAELTLEERAEIDGGESFYVTEDEMVREITFDSIFLEGDEGWEYQKLRKGQEGNKGLDK